mmetsp:Transcript_33946/g.80595  ORF Transcript_33946/g.80595 Transcript_33946/m.80595 type:complete len:271 (+) Transcript_33946:286-1098(+)
MSLSCSWPTTRAATGSSDWHSRSSGPPPPTRPPATRSAKGGPWSRRSTCSATSRRRGRRASGAGQQSSSGTCAMPTSGTRSFSGRQTGWCSSSRRSWTCAQKTRPCQASLCLLCSGRSGTASPPAGRTWSASLPWTGWMPFWTSSRLATTACTPSDSQYSPTSWRTQRPTSSSMSGSAAGQAGGHRSCCSGYGNKRTRSGASPAKGSSPTQRGHSRASGSERRGCLAPRLRMASSPPSSRGSWRRSQLPSMATSSSPGFSCAASCWGSLP